MNHKWKYCELCEHEVVICDTCGNNTCNGGYGEVDGKECDACPSAYELYSKGKMMNDKGKSIIDQIARDLISVQPMTGSMTSLFEIAKTKEELERDGYKPVSRIGLMWVKDTE